MSCLRCLALLGILFALPGLSAARAEEPTKDSKSEKPKADASLLTIDRIFQAKEFEGESPGRLMWSKRRPGYFTFTGPRAGGGGKDFTFVDAATGKEDVILPAHAFIVPGQNGPLSIDSLEISADESKLLIFTNSQRVWRANTRGDYWVLDIAARELRKLGGDAAPSSLMFAHFSPDSTRVAYVRENNLYVQELRMLEVTQLTSDGSATTINGTADWVYEEELALQNGYRWSPDGKSIAYWQFDTTGVREFFLLNNTKGLYAETTPIPYPKVGEQNSSVRVGVVSAEGGETGWLELSEDPRNVYIAQMEWLPDSSALLIQQFNRLQNTNRVFHVNVESNEPENIFTEMDDAWLENENKVRWLGGGKEFTWLSERSGWRHLYRVKSENGALTPVTRGAFDVIKIVAAGEKIDGVYFSASPDNPTQCYLYHTTNDGTVKRITPADQSGWHEYDVSPDGQFAFHTWSSFTTPPVVELVSLPDHKVVRTLAENSKLKKKLDGLKKPKAEFFRVDIGGGVVLDGWRLLPPEFDGSKKAPVLFYVYGEPHGQTVKDQWGGPRGLWYWMLAQEGYVVASVDTRGTPMPRGRDWRKVVYKQVGILAPEEQAAAARALLKQWTFADPTRVGIWGYSGGGSSTLHAMFRFPDVYTMGMAVAAVPNQRLYDSIYQERYMGSPSENADGYRRGSPITYATGLKGKLLIVHGTGDDNVHYQGAEQLFNELIASNKPFSMMAYPNRSHALSEGPNTTRHFHELLTRYLHENLPLTPPAGSPPP